jgi:hypothetical protein
MWKANDGSISAKACSRSELSARERARPEPRPGRLSLLDRHDHAGAGRLVDVEDSSIHTEKTEVAEKCRIE